MPTDAGADPGGRPMGDGMAGPGQTPGDGGHPGSSYADLCESFLSFEADHQVFRRQVHGINYWRLVRLDILNQLLRDHGLAESPRPKAMARFRPVMVDLPMDLLGAREFRAGLMRGQRDWARLPTAVMPLQFRRHKTGGRELDVYCLPILRSPRWGPYLVLDQMHRGPATRSGDGTLVLPFSWLDVAARIEGYRGRLRPSPEARRECEAVTRLLRRHFPRAVVSPSAVAGSVTYFRRLREDARAILRGHGVERLVVASGRAAAPLVSAADCLGITTYELQHCAVGRHTLTWNYRGRPEVPYTSRYFLSFGTFWENKVDLPAGQRVVTFGSAIPEILSTWAGPRPAGSVIVLSQPEIGERLFRMTLEVARLCPGHRFSFKPHPVEAAGRYRPLLRAASLPSPNMAVLDPGGDLHATLAAHEVQVGVSSTSLFEGMAGGLRTVVAKLPGWEMMEGAIQRGDAVGADTPASLASLLGRAPLTADPRPYFKALDADPLLPWAGGGTGTAVERACPCP